jgi:hypothetical protein
MRRLRTTNYFSPHDSNTIDDITGFKRKKSQMVRRWDGFYTEYPHPRQPQDYPVVPQPQRTYTDIRTDPVQDLDDAASFDPI